MNKKNKKSGLGRGFDSLIPTDIISEEFDPTAAEDKNLTRTKHVLIRDVIPNPDQPRREFDEQSIEELAESIRQHGLLQPIVVAGRDGKYLLIAGERRWRASQLAGLERIPALIRRMDDQARLEVALVENIQREDLSPLELATALMKLRDQFNLTHGQISQRVGKAESTVKNIQRLLKLPDPAKRALTNGRITEQHARAILSLDGDPKRQQELLDYIIKYKWTAPKAEQFAASIKKGVASDTKQAAKRTETSTQETKAIAKKLKTKVSLRRMAKGGRIIIEYKNDKDYKRLTDKLSQ